MNLSCGPHTSKSWSARSTMSLTMSNGGLFVRRRYGIIKYELLGSVSSSSVSRMGTTWLEGSPASGGSENLVAIWASAEPVLTRLMYTSLPSTFRVASIRLRDNYEQNIREECNIKLTHTGSVLKSSHSCGGRPFVRHEGCQLGRNRGRNT